MLIFQMFLDKTSHDDTNLEDASPSTSNERKSIQIGSGEYQEDFINKISDLVTEKLAAKFSPITPNYHYYETSVPTVATEAVSENSSQPISYSVVLKKDDLNDKFDEKHLLSCVPKLHKQKALRLIQAIETQPQEITFDSKGEVYINAQSIPGSNIYKILPALFKQKKSKTLQGFAEVLAKLTQMNLSHLLNHSIKTSPKQSVNHGEGRGSNDLDDWWYIGP